VFFGGGQWWFPHSGKKTRAVHEYPIEILGKFRCRPWFY
jgi:hypothetical protein